LGQVLRRVLEIGRETRDRDHTGINSFILGGPVERP
jgi:hypothetical protein